uniref:Uncharacterized protein n=1 Tax=Helianthus annuus TaxID=4232 RepID=A0A251U5P3_HELAN
MLIRKGTLKKKILYGLMIGQRRLGLNMMVFLWKSTGKNALNIQNLMKTYGHELRA